MLRVQTVIIPEGNRKRTTEAAQEIKGSNHGFLFQARRRLEPIHDPSPMPLSEDSVFFQSRIV
jgi:hypothetical protein